MNRWNRPARNGALGLALLASTTAALAARPNLLVIYTDDQSHRSVGCYEAAHDWVRTPNIDRLAREGVRFRSAYIGTWCMASRATQLTGRLQYGIESMRMSGPYPGADYDPQACPFWPRDLRRHGYVTAQVGKWHTGRDAGFGRDWDLQAVWNRPNLTGDDVWAYYDSPKLEINGAAAATVTGYSTDIYTDLAVDFVRERRIGDRTAETAKPWYLWLCYSAVHGPYTPADRHLDRYSDSAAQTPVDIFPPRPDKPPHMRQLTRWRRGDDDQPIGFEAAVRKYHQAVASIDEGVGRVIEALEATGQLDNTLVVFTSDQGFAWGQHGLKEKWAPYDAALLAPLIFRLPGAVAEGAVCDAPVGGVDLPPTLLAMAGADPPWEMHGADLRPLLRDPSADWPHPVVLPQTHDLFGSDITPLPPLERRFRKQLPWYVMIRDGPHKLVRYLAPNEGEELYDLQADPDELANLIDDPRHTAVANRLRIRLAAELDRHSPGLPEALGW